MRVALVHDWLTGMRGGEKVLEEMCKIYPDADLYTLVHIKGSVSKIIENRKIFESFLGRFPLADKKYRWYLPLMPKAIESFNLEGYDLVISSSHCVAKGIISGKIPHICYCHTPMRYAWDMRHHYFNRERFGKVTLFVINKILPTLQKWDIKSADRPDLYIANSDYIRRRIKKTYQKEAEVLYPPVDTDYYCPGKTVPPLAQRDYYLIVSAFAPYKKVDLAVSVFAQNGKKLIIVGSGEDETRLKNMATPNVEFRKGVDDLALRELYRNAKGLLFPGEEDFGIVPVEAMSCGTPVIGYAKGGLLETVVPLRESTKHATGIYFDHQTKEALDSAVEMFETKMEKLDPLLISKHAEKFATGQFVNGLKKIIARHIADS